MKRFASFLFFLLIAASGWAQQANQPVTVLPLTTRTATISSADQYNPGARGGHIITTVSSFVTGTFTVNIQGKDPVSLGYYNILTSPGIVSTGTTVMKVYPGIGTIVNGAASDILPYIWRVQLTASTSPTPTMTLSVGANLEQ